VRSLLPAEGMALSIADRGGGRIETTLTIRPPVIAGPEPWRNQPDSLR
jgi:hypothetical protein